MPKRRSAKKTSPHKVIFVILSCLVIAGLLFIKNSGLGKSVLGTEIAAGKQLQIETLSFPPKSSIQPSTSTPVSIPPTQSFTPVPPSNLPDCPYDTATNSNNGQQIDPNQCTCTEYYVECRGGICVNSWVDRSRLFYLNPNFKCDAINQAGWCTNPAYIDPAHPDGFYCMAKPVIYLYPQTPTKVDVKVTAQNGQVVISNPLYNQNFQGWQGVLANPNGDLNYQGKNYSELFYESSVKTVTAPKNGLILETNQLDNQLSSILTKLGLKDSEKQEFLDYWLPNLKKLNSPYILFSLIDDQQKQIVDNVSIYPKPDKFISVLAYFKALQAPINIQPLPLPKAIPERVGFTAVEWGGTIDPN